MKSEALLIGRIFDDRGNRMSPSHARKGGVKYRYYLSSALLQGMAGGAGSVRRVPTADIEALVVRSVREHLKPVAPIDEDRKSTRLNSSHQIISYAVFCLKKKKQKQNTLRTV